MVARPRRHLSLIALLLALATGSCAGSAPTGERAVEVVGAPPQNVVARLDDEQLALPDGRVAWHTWWVLCWDAYPSARGYELEAVTGEGVSPRLRDQPGTCLRVEAASGEDRPESVAARRSTLLALQQGQLAYRVRAVLDGDRRSEWTAPQAVGGGG